MNLFHFPLNTGSHLAGWRAPNATATGLHDLGFYQNLARIAERGKFDALFFADSVGFYPMRGRDAFSRADVVKVEPLTLLAALAATTTRLGLVATGSTTYNSPYTLARQFASIDHLSGGRAGWNIVTSSQEPEARNYGVDHHAGHAERYARAREFVDVVTALWDSFEDGAVVIDKAAGRYFDPAKLHGLDHDGPHFKVAGPLNIARPPQGHPVLVQAGGSPTGMRFAADLAEVIFTSHRTFDSAQGFYTEFKALAAQAGRSADATRVLPSIQPVIGATEAEAEALLAELDALIPDDLALSILETNLGGIDLSGHDPDGPLPDIAATEGIKSTQDRLLSWARQESLSIRQLARGHAAQRTGNIVAGTPERIADVMQHWFTAGAADGFMVTAPYLPGGFEIFVDTVVPILQARGLFRTDYAGTTLRDHLGLARPENVFVRDPGRHAEPRIW